MEASFGSVPSTAPNVDTLLGGSAFDSSFGSGSQPSFDPEKQQRKEQVLARREEMRQKAGGSPLDVPAPVSVAQPQQNVSFTTPTATAAPAALRDDLIRGAIEFLTHPRVANSDADKKRRFLKSKGMTDEEIAEAFKRSGSFGRSKGVFFLSEFLNFFSPAPVRCLVYHLRNANRIFEEEHERSPFLFQLEPISFVLSLILSNHMFVLTLIFFYILGSLAAATPGGLPMAPMQQQQQQPQQYAGQQMIPQQYQQQRPYGPAMLPYAYMVPIIPNRLSISHDFVPFLQTTTTSSTRRSVSITESTRFHSYYLCRHRFSYHISCPSSSLTYFAARVVGSDW
jgi:hypothetical protein